MSTGISSSPTHEMITPSPTAPGLTPMVAITKDNTAEAPFSVYSRMQKGTYVYIASLAAFASPVSSAIYYPALSILATDLDTTVANINLTITTYMIFQGLAPTIVGGFSDRYGRRPAYLVCFIIYIAANTGLALQNSYTALLILRCLQSCGSSGTIALSNGVVSDVATRAERGSYIGLAALGQSLGPAFGPVIGGLLVTFLGWRAIFWFLDIYAGLMLIVFLVFVPETCRNVVGNGSVYPQKWNVSLIQYLRYGRGRDNVSHISQSKIQNKRRPGLLSSIPILFEKECFLILIFGGFLYAGFYTILAGLPSQLIAAYNYNSIQVGLCYIPIGAGSMVSKSVVGRIIDWNFHRHARKHGLEISKTRQQDIRHFPVERARLEVGLTLVYVGCITIIPYGWVIQLDHPPLAAIVVLLFVNTIATSGCFQAMSVLLVDCNPGNAAAASAAGNLIRCLLGAGAVAGVVPLLNKIGSGWTATLVSLIWVLMSSFWWAVIIRGSAWRESKRIEEDKIESEDRENQLSHVQDNSKSEKVENSKNEENSPLKCPTDTTTK